MATVTVLAQPRIEAQNTRWKPGVIWPGTTIRITVETPNASGTLADPATGTLKFITRSPRGQVTTYIYGTDAAVTKLATGRFAADVTPQNSGRWFYRFQYDDAGEVSRSVEGWFNVRSSGTSNSFFLTYEDEGLADEMTVARDQVLNVSITGGTANAIVGTTIAALPEGDGKTVLLLRPTATNTGGTTLALNGGSALSVRNFDGGEVSSGLLIAGGQYALARFGSEYWLLADVVNRSEVTYRFELLAGISSDTSLPIVLGAVPLIAYAPTGGTITHVAALCSRAGLTGSEASASLSLEILKNGTKHGSTLTISSTLDDAFTHNAALASALTFVAGDEIMLLWYASGGTQFTKVLAAARGYYT